MAEVLPGAPSLVITGLGMAPVKKQRLRSQQPWEMVTVRRSPGYHWQPPSKSLCCHGNTASVLPVPTRGLRKQLFSKSQAGRGRSCSR